MDTTRMKENEAMLDGGSVLVDQPTIQVIDCEVQHPVSKGSLSLKAGTVGVGIIVQPSGQPKIMLKLEHSDGSNLVAFLRHEELVEFGSMLMDANEHANEIQTRVSRSLIQ